jgi:hypothetical protein
VEGCKPIFADKVISYEDDAFTDRLNLTPPVVPNLTIVRAQHRTRALTASEAETVDVDDIVNKAEILKAISDVVGLDFTGFASSEVDQDISLAA